MENINVRKFKISDTEDYFKYSESHESLTYSELQKVESSYSAKRTIERLIRDYDKTHEDKRYCIALESTDKMIGGINVYKPRLKLVEVGLWIWRDYQKQGFGGQAINQIKELLKREHIICHVLNTNKASIALMNKIGYIETHANDICTSYILT